MSTQPDGGGQAFPETACPGVHNGSPGMTLRDYFAAQVMVGFGTWTPGTKALLAADSLQARAELAYAQVDAMLEARKR